MRKRNEGFTLIELLIAIAVLSTMAAVLLKAFVLSSRMSQKARADEILLDLASKTMEEVKGYSFQELDLQSKNGDTTRLVEVGGSTYDYRSFSEKEGGEKLGEESDKDEASSRMGAGEGYILTRPFGRNPENGQAEYLISVEADRGRYGAEAANYENEAERLSVETDSNIYTINQFAMPDIAVVSSYQNVVIDPGTLVKSDALLMAELLEKVNKEEDEKESYTEDAVRKFLLVKLSEQANGSGNKGGRLSVNVRAVYTVDPDGPKVRGSAFSDFNPRLTIEKTLYSAKKRIVLDDESGEKFNRIYVFLPDERNIEGARSVLPDSDEKGYVDDDADDSAEVPAKPVRYEKVWIAADQMNTRERYKFYLVVPSTGYEDVRKEDQLVVNQGNLSSDRNTGAVELYSNIDDGRFVSQGAPRDRLYHLTVTIYRAAYDGEGGSLSDPAPGEELIRLESTKSEQLRK